MTWSIRFCITAISPLTVTQSFSAPDWVFESFPWFESFKLNDSFGLVQILNLTVYQFTLKLAGDMSLWSACSPAVVGV